MLHTFPAGILSMIRRHVVHTKRWRKLSIYSRDVSPLLSSSRLTYSTHLFSGLSAYLLPSLSRPWSPLHLSASAPALMPVISNPLPFPPVHAFAHVTVLLSLPQSTPLTPMYTCIHVQLRSRNPGRCVFEQDRSSSVNNFNVGSWRESWVTLRGFKIARVIRRGFGGDGIYWSRRRR